jgi:hypothetical protein
MGTLAAYDPVLAVSASSLGTPRSLWYLARFWKYQSETDVAAG